MALEQTLCLVLILVTSILAGVPFARPSWKWLLLAVAFQATNGIALVTPHCFPVLRFGHWNWTGKLFAVAASLCWIWGIGLSREQVGLRLPADARGWAATFLGILLLGGLSAGERIFAGAQPFDAETLAFQATMPGLDEEFAYRGLLFALLWRGLPSLRGRAVSAAIVVIFFWLAHVIAIREGVVHYEGLKPDVLLASILFMTLRLLTRSIIVTMVAHDLDNIANTLA